MCLYKCLCLCSHLLMYKSLCYIPVQRHMCFHVSICVFVSVFAPLSLYVSLLYPFLDTQVCVFFPCAYIRVCICVGIFICVSVLYPCLCFHVSICMFASVFAPLSVYVSLLYHCLDTQVCVFHVPIYVFASAFAPSYEYVSVLYPCLETSVFPCVYMRVCVCVCTLSLCL